MIKSRTTRRFRQSFTSLPIDIQQAVKAYRTFRANPQHPGLQFKKVEDANDTYSVRIGLGYRALAIMRNDELIWFWIGSYSKYDRLI